MQIQKVSADRLNPAAYNPRRDLKPSDKDYEKLKRSIEEFGFFISQQSTNSTSQDTFVTSAISTTENPTIGWL